MQISGCGMKNNVLQIYFLLGAGAKIGKIC
jgi:hypothetical protein